MSTPSIEELFAQQARKDAAGRAEMTRDRYKALSQLHKTSLVPCGVGANVMHPVTTNPKPRYRLHEVHDSIPELFAVIKDDEDSGRVVAQVETREDADLVLEALNSYKP